MSDFLISTKSSLQHLSYRTRYTLSLDTKVDDSGESHELYCLSSLRHTHLNLIYSRFIWVLNTGKNHNTNDEHWIY